MSWSTLDAVFLRGSDARSTRVEPRLSAANVKLQLARITNIIVIPTIGFCILKLQDGSCVNDIVINQGSGFQEFLPDEPPASYAYDEMSSSTFDCSPYESRTDYIVK